MKKLLFMMVCLVAAVAMTSCSSNTPKGVATKFMQALKNQDADDLVEVFGDEDGNKLSKEDATKFKAMLEQKLFASNIKNLGSFKFKYLDEDVDEENGEATVNFEVTSSDGDTDTAEIELRKGDDGKWRVIDF